MNIIKKDLPQVNNIQIKNTLFKLALNNTWESVRKNTACYKSYKKAGGL
jgi:hypothetical protein